MAVSATGEISLISSFALVCSASIGTGVLILSYGVMQAGLALGSLFMVFASICGSLTESIIIVSALKLNAKSLTSLIARTVAYSVIREKRQIMKKRRVNSSAERGECSLDDSNSEYSAMERCTDRRAVGSRLKLGKCIIEEDRVSPQGFGERRSQGHTCWSDVSDLESSVSDLECVRNSPQHAGHHFGLLLHTDLLHIIHRLRGGAPQPADTHPVREVSGFRLCLGSHLLHRLRQQQDLPQHSLLRPGIPRLLPAKHLQDSEAGLSLPGILHHLSAICHVQVLHLSL
ncbi:hypothetical protein OJ253_529 [Cryptosporidium canis]|uniref:Uncharacterized protein n=1 Tax=Cryptosporidium canis TaxID=195482 RepID=A0A9D5DKN0_9CRYT|nr:hypothetical protein OJ253_529 [Cryptosporidium canis]